MKLPNSEHTSRPWRIHAIAPDFEVEDVWALPTPGGPGDFPRLVRQGAAGDTSDNASWAARMLFRIRWKLGELFGWDDADAGVGARVPTLRDRLPADLRDGPAGPDMPAVPMRSLYLTDDEWAAEMANRTVHSIMHVGWVPDGAGGYRGQMAVLVKPNGLFGRAYMAAIAPFRHLIVYPGLMRQVAEDWQPGSSAAQRGNRKVKWAGGLIALYGTAHTLAALTVEGAAGHAGAWFSRELWGEDFTDMSAANSAWWFSGDSFGVPLTLVGLTVLWLGRRDIAPPAFLVWSLAAWFAIDAAVLGPGPNGVIPLAAIALLARPDRSGALGTHDLAHQKDHPDHEDRDGREPPHGVPVLLAGDQEHRKRRDEGADETVPVQHIRPAQRVASRRRGHTYRRLRRCRRQ